LKLIKVFRSVDSGVNRGEKIFLKMGHNRNQKIRFYIDFKNVNLP
jgi:hypothetical protein